MMPAKMSAKMPAKMWGRRHIVTAVAAAVTMFGLTAPVPASAAADANSKVTAAAKAGCQVHAVLASKEGNGEIPRSLEFLRETLKDDQFAAYKSFHLVDKKTLSLQEGKAQVAALSTGHRAKVTLLSGDAKRLRLHLDLTARDGKGPLVRTDYSIENNGLFMIQAGKFTQQEVTGKLLFAFQCAVAG